MNKELIDDMDDNIEEIPPTIKDATDDDLIQELTNRGDYIIIQENSLQVKERILDFLHSEIYPNLNDKANRIL